MLDTLLSYVAPHYCINCGIVGSILCNNCKYDIISEPWSGCIMCGRCTSTNVCTDCNLPYSRAWCIGERKDVTERLINAYKFERNYAVAKLCTDILDECLPELPNDSVIISVPTISKHIRQRGYDHIGRIAKAFAKKRKIEYSPPIYRELNTIQLGKNRSDRLRQAEHSFTLRGQVRMGVPYLVFDDIFTTGATIGAVARLLRSAGVRDVWVTVLARQPLDNRGKIKYNAKSVER